MLGPAGGLGEQLGMTGLMMVGIALLLLRREVNRVLHGVSRIQRIETRLAVLEAVLGIKDPELQSKLRAAAVLNEAEAED